MSILQNIECHIVTDGTMWMDGGGAFGLVPREVWKSLLPPDEQNRVPLALNSLLIRADGQTILVDTGYGNQITPEQMERIGLTRPDGDIIANLAKLGVQPEDINLVINTHLHGDHCSGNTILVNGERKPAFPNARYVVQRREFADAITQNERTRATYFPDNYLPLYQTGQLELLKGDTQLTSQVRVAITRGHTRAHQVVILESGDETAIFMADLATLHYHFQRLAWVPSYDVEPLESIETKRFWQQWAIDHDATLIFEHDTQITLGKLVKDGKRLKVVARES